MIRFLFYIFLFFFISLNLKAANLGPETGYKIPRFVSIKSNEVNLRVGSSTNYPIILTFKLKNTP